MIDLRQLQSQSSFVEPDLLRRFLELAPAWAVSREHPVLLDGDPHWAGAPSATVLLNWLGQRSRHVCFTPRLGEAALEALTAWYGLHEVCTPSLDPAGWPLKRLHCQPSSLASEPSEALTLQQRGSEVRLAYLSPMPPQRSGISDYSLALLPHLAEHFTIDVVTEQPWSGALPQGVRAMLTTGQFARLSHDYDHVLYQLGNSPAHLGMMRLLRGHPGVVVLHDFFLGHVLCSPEADEWLGGTCVQRLYTSHGYQACLDLEASRRLNNDDHIWAYPCNLELLGQADGVIVHSREASSLASRFYGPSAGHDWALIPHLKRVAVPALSDRARERDRLGFGGDAVVICSFGFLGLAKRSELLLEAFLSSSLAADPRCALVFAGSAGSDHRLLARLRRAIQRAREHRGLQAQVRLTGWIDADDYGAYLAAADLAVQLRGSSRGESSGTVLDCLAGGVPLIVNAHGSLREIPDGCVTSLPDACDATDVRTAMESLVADPVRRRDQVQQALRMLAEHHRPELCAAGYAEAIHQAGARAQRRQRLMAPFRSMLQGDEDQAIEAANTLSLLFPAELRQRQLFLDVSALAQEDLGSGVQRVVRSLCQQLLARPPAGFRVEPVVACADGLGYRYARRFTTELMQAAIGELEDGPIACFPGDLFLGIDLSHGVVLRQRPYYQLMRAQGAEVHFVVHDLLPCTLPECFPPGAEDSHRAWLEVVLEADGAVCVSRSVASELQDWRAARGGMVEARPYSVGWFHHGADFQPATFVKPGPPGLAALQALGRLPTLLMVGTVEPRKAYLEVLEAASDLWARGTDFNLVIVGREGWTDLPAAARRTLPATVAAIRSHPRLNQQLFWFDAASDGLLQRLYERADGLIGASFGEGFGIPLIEAAALGLPLFLRDLPVFREVAGDGASFFPRQASRQELGDALAGFLLQIAATTGTAAPAGVPRVNAQTWSQSADQLVRALGLEPGLEAAPWVATPPPERNEGCVKPQAPQPRPGRRQRLRRRLGQLKRMVGRLMRRRSRQVQEHLPPSLAPGVSPALLPGGDRWLQVLGRQR